MAVFNCSPSELKKIIISTQISDLPTGELAVTDSLKIKGCNGVSISVDGDELLLGIDGNSFPMELKGEKGDKGEKGEKGDPYTLTEQDKSSIVADVLSAMPVAEELSV